MHELPGDADGLSCGSGISTTEMHGEVTVRDTIRGKQTPLMPDTTHELLKKCEHITELRI